MRMNRAMPVSVLDIMMNRGCVAVTGTFSFHKFRKYKEIILHIMIKRKKKIYFLYFSCQKTAFLLE